MLYICTLNSKFSFNLNTCDAIKNKSSVMWCIPVLITPRATPGNI